MRKLASRSMFWLAIALLLENVSRIVIDGGMLNLMPLVLLWIATAIAKGSTTACRWAMFFMGLYVTVEIVGFYVLITDPPAADVVRPIPLPIDFGLSLMWCVWSGVNLILAARALREAGQQALGAFGRKAVTVVVVWTVLIALFEIVGYLATPSYGRPGAIESRYSEEVSFLRDVAATGQAFTSSADVHAVFDEHPEILEAKVQTEHVHCDSGISTARFVCLVRPIRNRRG